MPGGPRRDIAPFLQRVRSFLLGREHTLALRFEEEMSDRSTPPPKIPDGPSHKLIANRYYNRSAMSSMKPPIDVLKAGKYIGDGKSPLPTPGELHQWDWRDAECKHTDTDCDEVDS